MQVKETNEQRIILNLCYRCGKGWDVTRDDHNNNSRTPNTNDDY